MSYGPREGFVAWTFKELWKNIESNTQIFNPRKLPNILVPVAGLWGTSVFVRIDDTGAEHSKKTHVSASRRHICGPDVTKSDCSNVP